MSSDSPATGIQKLSKVFSIEHLDQLLQLIPVIVMIFTISLIFIKWVSVCCLRVFCHTCWLFKRENLVCLKSTIIFRPPGKIVGFPDNFFKIFFKDRDFLYKGFLRPNSSECLFSFLTTPCAYSRIKIHVAVCLISGYLCQDKLHPIYYLLHTIPKIHKKFPSDALSINGNPYTRKPIGLADFAFPFLRPYWPIILWC